MGTAQLERDGALALLTLDNPPLNQVSATDTWLELALIPSVGATHPLSTAFISAAPRFVIEALGMILIAVLAIVISAREGGFALALPTWLLRSTKPPPGRSTRWPTAPLIAIACPLTTSPTISALPATDAWPLAQDAPARADRTASVCGDTR